MKKIFITDFNLKNYTEGFGHEGHQLSADIYYGSTKIGDMEDRGDGGGLTWSIDKKFRLRFNIEAIDFYVYRGTEEPLRRNTQDYYWYFGAGYSPQATRQELTKRAIKNIEDGFHGISKTDEFCEYLISIAAYKKGNTNKTLYSLQSSDEDGYYIDKSKYNKMVADLLVSQHGANLKEVISEFWQPKENIFVHSIYNKPNDDELKDRFKSAYRLGNYQPIGDDGFNYTVYIGEHPVGRIAKYPGETTYNTYDMDDLIAHEVGNMHSMTGSAFLLEAMRYVKYQNIHFDELPGVNLDLRDRDFDPCVANYALMVYINYMIELLTYEPLCKDNIVYKLKSKPNELFSQPGLYSEEMRTSWIEFFNDDLEEIVNARFHSINVNPVIEHFNLKDRVVHDGLNEVKKTKKN